MRAARGARKPSFVACSGSYNHVWTRGRGETEARGGEYSGYYCHPSTIANDVMYTLPLTISSV